MRPGARLRAASEVLEAMFTQHRPAAQALSDWGRAHRFAGSGDRSAIGTLVYDALRRRQSLAARMGAGTPRALVLGAAQEAMGLDVEEIAALADGSQHALDPLSDDERLALGNPELDPVRHGDHILGDIPEWLMSSFVRAFGEHAVSEGVGLSRRAPIDLRVNALKATPEKVAKALDHTGILPAPLAQWGLRIPAPVGTARAPNVEAEASHGKGWFEIQDAGSQIAAMLSGAGPRLQVLDLCAGAGGKTLAMAAMMQNTGQIYAYDSDKTQLRPIFERLKRAGARNVQVLDAGDASSLDALAGRFDAVLVDAPCSGTGTWRRRPDAKWRLKPDNIDQRRREQAGLLETAAGMVKTGGRIVYVTCSVLPEENGAQIDAFVSAREGFSIVPTAEVWPADAAGDVSPVSADGREDTLLLTPARHDTDGFFIAILRKGA